MKIWCQSCGGFGKDPVWDPYEKGLKKRAKEVARPDTQVDLYGQQITIPGIDTYRASQNICATQSVKNAIRAEREGYDAFIMISTVDAGYREIREVVDIPVVFMLENCIHFALMLAPKYAFFTHNKALLELLSELAKRYGLAENMVAGDYLDLSYSAWPDMFGHPERYVDRMTQKAKGVIARGAGVLIPAALPLGVWLIQHGLAEIEGARVLDAWGVAIKTAELMVDLKRVGVTRARYGPPQKEVLEAIQKLYSD